MRIFYVIFAVFCLAACSHKHDHNHEGGHDHAKMEQHASCAGCAHHDKSDKEGACTACKGESVKERSCCSEGKSCADKEAGACTADTAATTALANTPKILKNISQEEFAAIYAKNSEKLGKKCSAPAQKYCGKTTKDVNVTENEVACLWTKVFRVTRETLPELDGTPCAKMIKGFAKK